MMPVPRRPALAVAFVALLGALWAGLVRLGWPWPLPQPDFGQLHGPLMVAGFLGTMIGLERAIALAGGGAGGRAARSRDLLLHAGPWLSALGAAALLLGAPVRLGAGLMALSALSLVVASVAGYRRGRSVFHGALVAGALAWLFGTVHWLAGQPIYEIVWLWLAFLVITVTAEQLILSVGRHAEGAPIAPDPARSVLEPVNLAPGILKLPSAWSWSSASLAAYLAALVLVFLGGAAPAHGWPEGLRLAGAGAILLAAWLLRFDPARRGLTGLAWSRFGAVAAMLAYGWLAIGGLLILALGPATAGLAYDAMLHAVFVGLVFSVFFAHVPTVLPELVGRPMAYRPAAWLPLILLQASLILRLVGDFGAGAAARQWGGLLNAAALLVLLGGIVASILTSTSDDNTID